LTTTKTAPLSLHDALPTSGDRSRIGINLSPPTEKTPRMTSGSTPRQHADSRRASPSFWPDLLDRLRDRIPETAYNTWFSHLRLRSEEHTSELQSRENLVCR